jgi:hypothetical protein
VNYLVVINPYGFSVQSPDGKEARYYTIGSLAEQLDRVTEVIDAIPNIDRIGFTAGEARPHPDEREFIVMTVPKRCALCATMDHIEGHVEEFPPRAPISDPDATIRLMS